MRKIRTFKEYLNPEDTLEADILETLETLQESILSLKSDSAVQRILNDKNARISASELSMVLRSILNASFVLSREFSSAQEANKSSILSQQNSLSIAASVIAAAVAIRMQNIHKRK